MKKIWICVFVLISNTAFGQYFSIDTLELNTSYRALVDNPNSMDCQKRFFDAFPSTWREFITTYQYYTDDDYDLTMYKIAEEQVQAFGNLVTLLPDSTYCEKLIRVTIGGYYEPDAPNHLKSVLHEKMWSKTDAMLQAISKRQKGHRMQFWQFFWSNNCKSKPLEEEFERLKKRCEKDYPEEMKTMTIAFDYFYNGVCYLDSR